MWAISYGSSTVAFGNILGSLPGASPLRPPGIQVAFVDVLIYDLCKHHWINIKSRLRSFQTAHLQSYRNQTDVFNFLSQQSLLGRDYSLETKGLARPSTLCLDNYCGLVNTGRGSKHIQLTSYYLTGISYLTWPNMELCPSSSLSANRYTNMHRGV